MSLSLIIPVYNEIKQLQVSIKKLPSLKRYFKNFEIIFVDDFSNDGTYNFLLKTSKKYKFVKISSVNDVLLLTLSININAPP